MFKIFVTFLFVLGLCFFGLFLFYKPDNIFLTVKKNGLKASLSSIKVLYPLINSHASSAQKNSLEEFYSIPQKLDFADKKSQLSCVGCYHYEKIYPIGWSTTGFFAYISEAPALQSGCFNSSLIILDTNNNQKIWNYNYSSCENLDKQTTTEAEDVPDDIESLWLARADVFEEKLKEYKILKQDSFEILLFPILYDQGLVEQNLTFSNTQEDNTLKIVQATLTLKYWWFFSVKDTQPGLKKSQKVYYWSYDEFDTSLFLSVRGFLKSPYEEKIIILVNEVVQEWDGPPHSVNRLLIGVDLGQLVSF